MDFLKIYLRDFNTVNMNVYEVFNHDRIKVIIKSCVVTIFVFLQKFANHAATAAICMQRLKDPSP